MLLIQGLCQISELPCFSPSWVSQSFLTMTCRLPRSFLRQKQSLPCCRGWCALAKGAAQVIFWLLWVGHGGTVGGYSSRACSPSFCLWGWPALLSEVCSQLLDSGVNVLAVVSVKFPAQQVSQVLELRPVCLLLVPAGFLLLRGGLFCQCHFQ